ncbi:hypothetical protein TOPH_07333 [Tolypocladium ophioglossoides CBS 100239]|uniref:Uncharacterized protein n=1 Tax=Tolypocladium ophioglossoides (strain CBS 100239) TaxID=1163406 RepID=A0A0L0N212_TOLOC|nr:hypothetical protein TOPH_07333 [Tolypocladium ophioglossoides CBS 100239]
MATNGDNFLDYSYPDLDSWSRGEDGYFHNTSGVKKSKLSRGDKAQEPDPGREAREWEAACGASGSGAAGEEGEEDPWINPAGEGEEDVPVFSQTGDTDF